MSISLHGDDNRSRRGNQKKITAGLEDVIIRSVELLTDAERRYYQAEMMLKFLLVVALSGVVIRPGDSDNREEFGRIESRDRLKGLILYLRHPAHVRQESAVEGHLIELDRQADPSFKTTFRYTWITAERLHATLI